MSTSRLPASALSPRRPSGPRCHGGASSLLRVGLVAPAQRGGTPSRPTVWRELDEGAAASVEHVVRRPLCAPGATLWS